jgi:methyltransferase (TIGR00027 family)
MGNPVSKTAYYCAGTRMLDAHAPHPLIGDSFAERFMGEDGKRVFAEFEGERLANGTNVTRCHLFDELARSWLRGRPNGLVVLVGAGFDSRAFRLTGGRWVEVDEAPIMDRKEQVAAAASCPNPLSRVSIDFARETLRDKLRSFAEPDEVLVIVEGVLPYLEEAQIDELAQTLAQVFPRHVLACDLLTRYFIEQRGSRKVRSAFEAWGAHFRWKPDGPVEHVRRLGYVLREQTSIPLRAAELRQLPALLSLASFVLRWLLPKLRDGYTLCLFERA